MDDIVTTPQEAVDYLVQNWAEIPFGGAYPSPELDSFGAFVRDADLLKVRTPLAPDRRKWGVIMAFSNDIADDIPDIVREFAHRIESTVEYRLASDHDIMRWRPITDALTYDTTTEGNTA